MLLYNINRLLYSVHGLKPFETKKNIKKFSENFIHNYVLGVDINCIFEEKVSIY